MRKFKIENNKIYSTNGKNLIKRHLGELETLSKQKKH